MLALPAPQADHNNGQPDSAAMIAAEVGGQALSEVDASKLAESLSKVQSILEPVQALLPALQRLPEALTALEALPKVQEMVEKSLRQSTMNKVLPFDCFWPRFQAWNSLVHIRLQQF